MKKTILILSALFFMSCSKECFLTDNVGNSYTFKGDNRAAWSEYQASGKTQIGNILYTKTDNPLYKFCD